MSLYVGTSGWAYAAWKPVFYPAKLPQKKFLEHYATRLNTVEVNYSFRRMISEKTIESWKAETPTGFRFSVKAHQAITHIRKLKNAEEIVKRFLSSIEPLAAAGKLGPVLLQLPPTFKADAALLDDFLGTLPKSFALRTSLEFRHPSWFTDQIFAVLERHNCGLCLAESEERSTPEVRTADFYYYRFRKSDYPAETRSELADKIAAKIGEGRDVFAYFKHEERPESPLWAEEMLAGLKEAA